MKTKISIIIPHKNSLSLLERCLNSIPKQDSIQVIVVDDNSDPSKVDFERMSSLQKDNVEIIFNKESLGAGHARNLGLEKASGKWLLFADADDFFVDGAFEIISSHYDDMADIIYFLSERRYSDSMVLFDPSCMGLNDKIKAFDGNFETLNRLRYGICVPWGRMFRHSMVKNNNIRFGETRFANDTMFSVKTAYYADKIQTDCRIIYCFTANKGSLTHTLNRDSILCRYKVDIEKNVFLKTKGFPKYQTSVTPHIYHSLKYGICFTMQLIRIAIENGINPFMGSINWIISHYQSKNMMDNITKWE